MQDNDSKRIRAVKKASTERELQANKDKEISAYVQYMFYSIILCSRFVRHVYSATSS